MFEITPFKGTFTQEEEYNFCGSHFASRLWKDFLGDISLYCYLQNTSRGRDKGGNN